MISIILLLLNTTYKIHPCKCMGSSPLCYRTQSYKHDYSFYHNMLGLPTVDRHWSYLQLGPSQTTLPIPSCMKYAHFLWHAFLKGSLDDLQTLRLLPFHCGCNKVCSTCKVWGPLLHTSSRHLCWHIFSFHIPVNLQEYFIAVLIWDSLVNDRGVKCIFVSESFVFLLLWIPFQDSHPLYFWRCLDICLIYWPY